MQAFFDSLPVSAVVSQQRSSHTPERFWLTGLRSPTGHLPLLPGKVPLPDCWPKLGSIFADVDSNLGLELAMNELVVLKEAYKKAKKDGYGGIFVLCGGFWEKIWLIPAGNTQTPEQLKEELLPQCKENFKRNSDPTPYLYTKDEDFCVGKPITLDDIRC